MKKDPKYARRLLKLAAFLEKLPRKRFDYDSWVGRDWRGAPDLSCGTTACALGWATTMPSFRRLGLRLFGDSFGGGDVGIVGHGAGPYTAGAEIFGVSDEEFDLLFIPGEHCGDDACTTCIKGMPGSGATPKQVARHIRAFVKRETGRV